MAGYLVAVVGVPAVPAARPARKAWASATSSCWPRSVPGWVGRAIPAIVLLVVVGGRRRSASLLMVFAGRDAREVPIPFGPYLAGAGMLSLYFAGPLSRLIGLG
jgi:hypothetical protein